MEKNRLKAVSDGVIAFITTIMVLELGVPEHLAESASHIAGLADLKEVLPVVLSYVLSFLHVGIYRLRHLQ